jgi:hypothetical protein
LAQELGCVVEPPFSHQFRVRTQPAFSNQ